MSLLEQDRIDELSAVAMARVARKREKVRRILWSRGQDSRPAGFENLDTPEKVRLFTRHMARQANREVHQVVPGNLHQTVLAHPAFMDMMEDSSAVTG